MITKVTAQNDAKYDELFAAITAAFETDNKSEIKITRIEDYYAHLSDIAKLVNGRPQYAYFMRVPVDEGMFEINANTRTISTPAEYAQNGIAVKGDADIEILWFKIDRYYDLQDFGEDDVNIKIYWSLPGSKDIGGYSSPVFKDVYSNASQLIFGWSIPQMLTEYAGSLNFFIRFDRSKGFVYNTLPTSVKIKESYALKNNTDLDVDPTNEDSIFGRLTNTSNTGSIYLRRPYLSLVNTSYEIDTEDKLLSDDKDTYIYVSAYSEDDDAEFNYTFYKDGVIIAESPEVIGTGYKQTLDTEVNPMKQYYTAEGDIKEEVVDLTQAYEKCARLKVNSAGSYQCKIIASINRETETHYSAPTYTMCWVWEKPSNFVINENTVTFKTNKNGIIDSTDNGVNSRTIIINWPTSQDRSKQQALSDYTCEISSENSNIKSETIEKTEQSQSHTLTINPQNDLWTDTLSVKFVKELNKVSLPSGENDASLYTKTLSIQSSAKPYDPFNLGGDKLSFDLGVEKIAEVTVALASNTFRDEQTYAYYWSHSKGVNGPYVSLSNNPYNIEINKLEENVIIKGSFSQVGYYRLNIVANYGLDSQTTYSQDYVSVFKMNI